MRQYKDANAPLEVNTKRIEALTDGIFAIAMTLLAFGLPFPQNADLGSWLMTFWPRFLSFLISFVIAGVFWVATHTDFRYIRRTDHILIWRMIVFLLFISLIPFSAGMFGRYYTNPFAVIIYGGNMWCCVAGRYGIWKYATRHHHLVDADLAPAFISFNMQLSLFPLLTYSLALVFALFSLRWSVLGTWPSVALYVITPVPYILGSFYRHMYKTNPVSGKQEKRQEK